MEVFDRVEEAHGAGGASRPCGKAQAAGRWKCIGCGEDHPAETGFHQLIKAAFMTRILLRAF
jgi:hypothetical protein